jgi:hypothetical protein
MVNDILFDLEERFTLERKEERSAMLFQKLLIAFALFKVIVLWSLADTFFAGNAPKFGLSFSKIVFIPSIIAAYSPTPFFIIVTLILFGILFIRGNYITNFLLFWIVINIVKIKYPVTNGSDYVLGALAFYNIFLSFTEYYEEKRDVLSNAAFNLAHLMARIQIILIYVISGWDKLFSNAWFSGKAFQYVAHIETVYNPVFGSWITTKEVSVFLSWLTIIFELSFAILVWNRYTRLLILGVGVIFHLMIWLMLSLPDFSLIMVISYTLFLRRSDFKKLGIPSRQQLQ